MHSFLSDNQNELIARCKHKVAQRPHRGATPAQLANGVPMFLEQLTRTLLAEKAGDDETGVLVSGPAGGDRAALSQIGQTATTHGQVLMQLGYTVDQVVHDYGDLCQAITDLAFERDVPFSVDEFRTLNRCLDNAIADAVTAFSAEREHALSRLQTIRENERFGVLVHELRNALQTATLSFLVLRTGSVPIGGATGALMANGLKSLARLLDSALDDAKAQAVTTAPTHTFPLAAFIDDARRIAALRADARGCALTVAEVDAGLALAGDRDQLLAALVNLLQNAVKFTRPHTDVTLHAYAVEDRVRIDVGDHCGGLPHGLAETMFAPFTQGGFDRSGLGLGLTIARRTVEAHGGELTVHDRPGIGCVFTMSLPRHGHPRGVRGP